MGSFSGILLRVSSIIACIFSGSARSNKLLNLFIECSNNGWLASDQFAGSILRNISARLAKAGVIGLRYIMSIRNRFIPSVQTLTTCSA